VLCEENVLCDKGNVLVSYEGNASCDEENVSCEENFSCEWNVSCDEENVSCNEVGGLDSVGSIHRLNAHRYSLSNKDLEHSG